MTPKYFSIFVKLLIIHLQLNIVYYIDSTEWDIYEPFINILKKN
jgi:hypothetical protein